MPTKIDSHIKNTLAASNAFEPLTFTIFLPDSDKLGKPVKDFDGWVKQAIELLTTINGGASAMSPVDGAWLNPETGQIVVEKTTPVFSYVNPLRFRAMLRNVRVFLHDFGRKSNQGEILVQYGDTMYTITSFVPLHCEAESEPQLLEYSG